MFIPFNALQQRARKIDLLCVAGYAVQKAEVLGELIPKIPKAAQKFFQSHVFNCSTLLECALRPLLVPF